MEVVGRYELRLLITDGEVSCLVQEPLHVIACVTSHRLNLHGPLQ